MPLLVRLRLEALHDARGFYGKLLGALMIHHQDLWATDTINRETRSATDVFGMTESPELECCARKDVSCRCSSNGVAKRRCKGPFLLIGRGPSSRRMSWQRTGMARGIRNLSAASVRGKKRAGGEMHPWVRMRSKTALEKGVEWRAPGRGTSSRKKKRNHGWILSDDP